MNCYNFFILTVEMNTTGRSFHIDKSGQNRTYANAFHSVSGYCLILIVDLITMIINSCQHIT